MSRSPSPDPSRLPSRRTSEPRGNTTPPATVAPNTSLSTPSPLPAAGAPVMAPNPERGSYPFRPSAAESEAPRIPEHRRHQAGLLREANILVVGDVGPERDVRHPGRRSRGQGSRSHCPPGHHEVHGRGGGGGNHHVAVYSPWLRASRIRGLVVRYDPAPPHVASRLSLIPPLSHRAGRQGALHSRLLNA